MKFLVLGHLCVDVFGDQKGTRPADVGPDIRWGGIFFSLATLANLADDGLIYPVFGVGEKEYDLFLERLRRYPNVDPSGIYRLPGPTNQVTLFYQNSERRIECSKCIAPPIPLERIKPYLPVDAILVNMISGFDVELDTLSSLRMLTQGAGTYLHLDIHSLTLGIDSKQQRFPRPVETWRRWCYLADTVQMNEEEAKVLALEYLPEEDLVKQILSLGLRGCVITRASRGATAWAQDQKKISRQDIPPTQVQRVVDPTGCGDVFAAAFLYHCAKHQNVFAAAEFGNRIAAMNLTYKGSDEIDNLAQFGKMTEAVK